MPKAEASSVETLFHHWRRGDAEAGQAMAQRFTDWFYAISVSRHGESAGAPAFKDANARFRKGVTQVTDARRLLSWAHGLARESFTAGDLGVRVQDGDFVSRFTRKQPPKALLQRARRALPDDMSILLAAYGGTKGRSDPLSVLDARYKVKRWLSQHMGTPFRELPDRVPLDRAPLPFYEAGHLSAERDEEALFELWALNEADVCRDLAEFAHFAIALRGGLPDLTEAEVAHLDAEDAAQASEEKAAAKAMAVPTPEPAATPEPEPAPAEPAAVAPPAAAPTAPVAAGTPVWMYAVLAVLTIAVILLGLMVMNG